MEASIKWEWETFPHGLDFLEQYPEGLNMLSCVPIAPIMIWVMGLENAKSRPATPAERAEMCCILEESLAVGGLATLPTVLKMALFPYDVTMVARLW